MPVNDAETKLRHLLLAAGFGEGIRGEQDREIRDWLRNSGYDVIEIAATDMDDQDAMTRHFRRLAQYLGMRDTRSRLRSDPSWFPASRAAVEGEESGTCDDAPRVALRPTVGPAYARAPGPGAHG